ncbi:hypothetical protein DBR43_09695 [Pedobacter sp. KBW06]|uniref:hypothetical protein n=1 Tax=Pedobacter sp. KBW06 TaxID=2153359 RepID=UPI000F590594|nr:hypothetical protein [Pedobacter sp. KBW06]RQO75600.1 hypothetical protein DBR43_09695 [Pedobacter sp. KBW06]
MNFFKKKKTLSLNAAQQRSAEKIALEILNLQRKVADFLNQKTTHLSARAWLSLLILFCGISASYLICLLTSAFK